MIGPPLNAIVTSLTKLSDRQIIIRTAADGWTLPDFKAGQFAVLGLPGSAPRCSWSETEFSPAEPQKMIRRAYSIASSPLDRGYYEFYISLVSDGALTPRLFALALGSRLWLGSKVVGMFTLDRVPRNRNIVLIATGAGLAPYLSMLRTEMECGEGRRFVVLHGAYHSWDMGYRSELQSMAHLSKNLTYLEVIDDPQSEPVPWTGLTGKVQDLYRGGWIGKCAAFTPSPDDTDVFLCGHPEMIDEMVGLLDSEGFSESIRGQNGTIHVERY